jgi:hypothetical protein
MLGRLKKGTIRILNGVGGVEPLLDLVDLSVPKKIRVQVAILRDPSTPLGMTATPSTVEGPLDEMQNIFWNEANVSVASAHGRIRVLEDFAPEAALRVHCSSEPKDAVPREANEYFGGHRQSGATWSLGYGEPVTVFIVKEVFGASERCFPGDRAGYVILERGMLERGNRAMAHRVAHVCGLHHVTEENNLMVPTRHGGELKPWQKAIFRNSPHVVHF